jgi:dihydroxy-acid dehydratase
MFVPKLPQAVILAVVQSGDSIELDIPGRKLHLDVSDKELETRRKHTRRMKVK